MDNIRLKKISASYRNELVGLLAMEVKNPLIRSVQVTSVDVSPDLRRARVYFTLPEDEKGKTNEVIKGLRRSKGFLKKELGRRINLRYTPELEFFYDEGHETENRLEELFRKIQGEVATKGADDLE